MGVPRSGFRQCSKCSATFRAELLDQHMLLAHPTQPKKSVRSAPRAKSEIPTQQSPAAAPSEADRALAALARQAPFKALTIEICPDCRRRITFLIDSRERAKAFDVDRVKNVISPHECNSQTASTSVYAYSGGIIDSNRRKH